MILDDELYNNVLNKIGRNVLLFQQLEQLLKYIITNGRFAGYVDEIEQIKKARANKTHKQTMGQLVNQYIESIQPETDNNTNEPIVLKDVFISVRLTVETSSIEYEQCKKALSHMVEQRNEMIHHLLPNFDNRSMESCVELINKLDKLTENLLKQIATINNQVIGMKKAYNFLTSDNGKYQLELLFIRNSEIITHLIKYLMMSKSSDGWAPLSEAAQFIKNHIPDELCKIRENYGFKSLKCLMLASEIFEFKTESTKKGGARVLFRQSDNVKLKD